MWTFTTKPNIRFLYKGIEHRLALLLCRGSGTVFMMMDVIVTAPYHAVSHKFGFHFYFVILAHLIKEKENNLSLNLN
jgi:hypothetical protein